MQVLLLVLFVVYLYVPYLLFKFFVEESIDLVRRKDATRVEEFFGAALPSVLLNAAAYLLLRFLHWTRSVVGVGLQFPDVDWNVASALLDPQLIAIRVHVASGPGPELVYLAVLYGGACAAGLLYGHIELRLFERGAAPIYFLAAERSEEILLDVGVDVSTTLATVLRGDDPPSHIVGRARDVAIRSHEGRPSVLRQVL